MQPYHRLCFPREDIEVMLKKILKRIFTSNIPDENFENTGKKDISSELNTFLKYLETFFRQSPDGIFFMLLDEPVIWDEYSDKESMLNHIFSSQKIRVINKAMADQYGGKVEDFIGLTPADIFRHNIPKARNIWRNLFDMGREYFFTEIEKSDGSTIFIEGSYTCIYETDGRVSGHFGIHRDITGRKKTEESLMQKSDEMERFFTVALDLLCIADTDGRFIRVNRAWERTLGYSIEELLGRSFLDFVHPDDFNSTAKAIAALSDQIPVLNFINRFLTSEGEYRFLEWRSYPSGKYTYTAARDITDRINYEFELNKLAERLTLATGSAGIGIWDWDVINNELIWDRRMFELYGTSKERVLDIFEIWRNAIHQDDRDSIESLFIEGVKGLTMFNADFRVVWPDGSLHYLQGHALVIRNNSGKAERITGVTRDITLSKKMEDKLVTLSTTDPLTQAFNRRYLLHVIDSEISRAVRYKSVFSVIMFDIDYFKRVNDTFGHAAGDEILTGIVVMMKNRIRKNDVLARWGGEEFMILLPGTSLDNAKIFADKLIVELRNLEFEQTGNITASFGVTEYRSGETSDAVLKRADELVYKAKNEGRDCVRFS